MSATPEADRDDMGDGPGMARHGGTMAGRLSEWRQRRRPGLKGLGLLWAGTAFATGVLAGWLWFGSRTAWDDHLTRAYVTGVTLYDSLTRGTTAPNGVTVTPVPLDSQALADAEGFARLPEAPSPAYVTQISIRDGTAEDFGGQLLRLAIVSDGLRYEVSRMVPGDGRTAPEKLGHVTRLMASLCSHPVLYAQAGVAPWQRVEGAGIWGCEAQPPDRRLPALLIALLALAVIYTGISDTSARFVSFAAALRARRQIGGPEAYRTEGPAELGAIVAAVNAYLEAERAQLTRRALVLSGVSHDLGTPATRLRLRSQLIEDPALREKFDRDIDQMTGMIESVLSYTRSELSAEAPRQLSLSSLVEAVVADYQDMGLPVEMARTEPRQVAGGASLLSGRRRVAEMPESGRLLITARPVALSRAVSNLIDNALKYGRRATVGLSATSQTVVITVEDEGGTPGAPRAAELEALVQPFRRGADSGTVDGFGLGLTIVTAVAEQHGGRLSFADGPRGLRALLEISRT